MGSAVRCADADSSSSVEESSWPCDDSDVVKNACDKNVSQIISKKQTSDKPDGWYA